MTQTCGDSPASIFRLWSSYAPTPLMELPLLAERCRVAEILVKDESRRPLGSFKSLGGMYAGLRALARATSSPDVATLVAARLPRTSLPTLICASDGNHGLAVAAGAELAGTAARIYLHRHVSSVRARRISERGAEIIWVDGTYDDAVDEASQAAKRGEGLLIADTSAQDDDPVVADVMAGYELIAQEIVAQLGARGNELPTHLFVQAGVGGLAAAMSQGLDGPHSASCRIIVVEPEKVACVGLALKLSRIERMQGDLTTAAEMLSCGEASAPAVKILLRHKAAAVAVSEEALAEAATTLAACGGPNTTASGATGLAGLMSALPGSLLAQELGVDANSRILLIVTEGTLQAD